MTCLNQLNMIYLLNELNSSNLKLVELKLMNLTRLTILILSQVSCLCLQILELTNKPQAYSPCSAGLANYFKQDSHSIRLRQFLIGQDIIEIQTYSIVFQSFFIWLFEFLLNEDWWNRLHVSMIISCGRVVTKELVKMGQINDLALKENQCDYKELAK